jgi:hypothetical protein
MSDGLRSFALATLASVLPPEDRSPEAQFLRSFGAPGNLDQYLTQPCEEDKPLLDLAEQLGLNRTEIVAVTIAMAVEMDPLSGRAVAHLQNPVGGSRPVFGLLASALTGLPEDGNVIGALLGGAAIESGLLQVLNENAPLAEHSISVPVPVCLALTAKPKDGPDVIWAGFTIDKDTQNIPLPPSVLQEAARHGRALAGGTQKSLVLRSGSPAEARAVAAEVAKSLGRRALFLDQGKDGRPLTVPTGIGPWLLLKGMVPVFCFELGPGERKSLPVLPRYRGPQLAICGPEGSLESYGETIPGWTLSVPEKQERLRLWETALGSKPLARELAGHRHGSGRIAQLGRLARYQSALEGRNRVQMRDIATASWTTEGAGLEALAQPLTHHIPDEALVTTPGLRDELNRLLLRCRGREGLGEGLGVSASTRYRPGVRALFCGPSGTGKTLAAGWIATRMGLPLYRVDLASVTSKYIGETEKNLAQLLARAEHAEVVLLFDEADSMFGKRTDVKESNDRFANAQTNYLLQRIESFDGIVLLTSNSQSRFDPAFFRRLDAIIEFPVPGPSERRSLWQAHLGADHLLTPREMNQLSAAVDLHGGNIRNAVLTSAVLARSESRPIGYQDVLDGLTDEYRKLGRQLPSGLQRNG